MGKQKTKIFIAAPLFNEMERRRNSEIKGFLVTQGYDTYLAQDDIGLSYDLIEDKTKKKEIRKMIFEADINGLFESDIVLLLLDGRTPDEGACIEVGYGWALKKPCIAYKTDNRAMDQNGDNNIMIDGCIDFSKLINNLEELKERLNILVGDLYKNS